MKRIFLTALVLGMLAGSVIAQGRGMHGVPHPGKGGFSPMGAPWMGFDSASHHGEMHGALRGIDLNEKQKKSIAKLKRDYRMKMIELRSDMAGTHAKGKLLIVSDKTKDSDIKEFADKISSFGRKMMIQKMNHSRTVRKILTEEQQVTFDNNILKERSHGQKKGEHMRKRMRKWHGEQPFAD